MAVAVDNEGHVTTSNTDARWAANDAESRLIFSSTSEHQLASVAKALIVDYYGRDPTYSYFDGCSDGGREALIEAQRYPHDFNGILAGAPADIQSELLGEIGTWNIRVNTGPGGREILTSEKLPALHAAVVRACGQGRGYVLDPRTCNFSPSSIECHGRATDSCLTAAQVRVVVSLYRGPSDLAGQSLYPGGEPYGSELGWSAWFVKPSGDQGLAPRHTDLPVRHQFPPLPGVPDRSTELVFPVTVPLQLVELPEADRALPSSTMQRILTSRRSPPTVES